MQLRNRSPAAIEVGLSLLRSENSIAYCRRSLAFHPQLMQGELIFMDAAEQLDTGDRYSGTFEVLEAEHRPGSGFDAAMILLDKVVQIF